MSALENSVYVLDDDSAVRDAMRELFSAEGIGVQTFTSAEAFLAWDVWKSHGCAIVDIHLHGMNGLDLLSELNARGSKISVIILTGRGDVPKAVKAFKTGAIDFIEKPFDPVELVKIVKKSLEGTGKKKKVESEAKDIHMRLSQLSPREKEVMDLIVLGNSNKMIASNLNISIRTVETHRAKIVEKTKCASVSELISIALFLKSYVK